VIVGPPVDAELPAPSEAVNPVCSVPAGSRVVTLKRTPRFQPVAPAGALIAMTRSATTTWIALGGRPAVLR
jgi:hypothetical protein